MQNSEKLQTKTNIKLLISWTTSRVCCLILICLICLPHCSLRTLPPGDNRWLDTCSVPASVYPVKEMLPPCGHWRDMCHTSIQLKALQDMDTCILLVSDTEGRHLQRLHSSLSNSPHFYLKYNPSPNTNPLPLITNKELFLISVSY